MALLAACSRETKPAQFDSYKQADRTLTALVEEHGETQDVPQEVSDKIKESLKGATPLFKKQVVKDTNRILESTTDNYFQTDDKNNLIYSVRVRTDDDGNKITTFGISDPDYTKAKELRIAASQDGDYEIVFEDNTYEDAEGPAIYSDIEFKFGDDISRFTSYKSEDGEIDRSSIIEFDGDRFTDMFTSDGPYLKKVHQGMEDITAFVSQFEAGVDILSES